MYDFFLLFCCCWSIPWLLVENLRNFFSKPRRYALKYILYPFLNIVLFSPAFLLSSPFKWQAMHDTTYWQRKHLTVSIHIAINVETSDTSPRAHKNKPTNTHTYIYIDILRPRVHTIADCISTKLWTFFFSYCELGCFCFFRFYTTMCRYAFIMLINNSTFSYILDGHAIDFYVCSAHSNVHCKAALFFIWFGFALNNLYGFSFTPSIFHPFVHSFMLNERWARTHMSDASEQEVFRFH